MHVDPQALSGLRPAGHLQNTHSSLWARNSCQSGIAHLTNPSTVAGMAHWGGASCAAVFSLACLISAAAVRGTLAGATWSRSSSVA